MQLADNPGRNEPGTGEINYAFLFALLDAIGYAGLDRLRIQAASTTTEGLGWLQEIAGWPASNTHALLFETSAIILHET